jgi:hypothetical protein
MVIASVTLAAIHRVLRTILTLLLLPPTSTTVLICCLECPAPSPEFSREKRM